MSINPSSLRGPVYILPGHTTPPACNPFSEKYVHLVLSREVLSRGKRGILRRQFSERPSNSYCLTFPNRIFRNLIGRGYCRRGIIKPMAKTIEYEGYTIQPLRIIRQT